MPHTVSIFCKC